MAKVDKPINPGLDFIKAIKELYKNDFQLNISDLQ